MGQHGGHDAVASGIRIVNAVGGVGRGGASVEGIPQVDEVGLAGQGLFQGGVDGVEVAAHVGKRLAAKDEFLNIKNVTRDDQLAAHRVPPQLMGIIPHNTGGFGDAEKAAKVFARNELEPLMNRYRSVNDWLGEEVVRFTPYLIE